MSWFRYIFTQTTECNKGPKARHTRLKKEITREEYIHTKEEEEKEEGEYGYGDREIE